MNFRKTGWVFFAVTLTIGIGAVPRASADLKTALYQRILERRALESARHESASSKDADPAAAAFALESGSPKNFPQVVDHFAAAGDSMGTKTFVQRYWYSSTYARTPDAPVFYYICGEATCEGVPTYGPIHEQVRRLGAHVVALEHRYYGTSQPFADLSSEHLKYLSTAQAIEDLANFQRFAMDKLNMKGKWIAVGGSYAGSVSAFYRLRHPELAAGSLASSAPVKAKADFFEYDRHVAKVAGPECLGKIKETVAEVERRMALGADDTAKVKELFHAEKVREDVDFTYVLADMASIAIQYGRAAEFCGALTAANGLDETLAAYSDVGTKMLTWFGIDAVEDSYQGAESLDPNDYVKTFGSRAWLYQSCTEYGYWQIANTTGDGESARSAKITLAYHDLVCDRLFGIKKAVDTQATNAAWYERLFDAKTSNIFFTNGGDDPWSNLSILPGSVDSARNPLLTFLLLPGHSHCDDLGSTIDAAATKFTALVDDWLK